MRQIYERISKRTPKKNLYARETIKSSQWLYIDIRQSIHTDDFVYSYLLKEYSMEANYVVITINSC